MKTLPERLFAANHLCFHLITTKNIFLPENKFNNKMLSINIPNNFLGAKKNSLCCSDYKQGRAPIRKLFFGTLPLDYFHGNKIFCIIKRFCGSGNLLRQLNSEKHKTFVKHDMDSWWKNCSQNKSQNFLKFYSRITLWYKK